MTSHIFLLLIGLASANPILPYLSTDRTYLYEYVARSVSGVPGTSDNSSGIQMTMMVAITFRNDTRAVLQITQCTGDAFIGKYPDKKVVSSFVGQELTDCDDLKKQCLPFDSFNGHITNIYPSPEEPLRILNMKRGILSAFNGIPVRKQGTVIEEQTDVLGRCLVEVRKAGTQDEVYLLKKRDTETCSNRTTQFSTVLPISKHQEAKFVFGETVTQMKFVKDGAHLILERSEVTEKQSFAPVSKDAGSAVVTLSQSLSRTHNIISSLPPCTINPLPGPPKTLEFEFPSPACNQQYKGLWCLAGPIIEEMANLEDRTEIAEKFASLIEEMRRCSKTSLQELKNKYVQCKSPESERLRSKHTYFLDALVWVGSEPAIDLISDLAKNNDMCLNGSRRRELIVSLSMVPLHRLCSPCKLLQVTLDIAKYNQHDMTSTLVLGAVIRLVLKHPHYHCTEEVQRSIAYLEEKYKKTSDVKEKIHVLKALGNSGSLKGLPVIADTLCKTTDLQNADELTFERRLAAIYAMKLMARVAPLKICPVVLPIYYNQSEEVEARIAAFLVYFQCAITDVPLTDFLQLVKSLKTESNSYVKSFVYTYLSEVETCDYPHRMGEREIISYIMKVTNIHYWCEGCDRGYFSSKATHGYASLADAKLPRSLPRDVMGVGLSTGFVFTDASNLPRSGMAKLTVNAFGYDFDAIEVGVRARGTARLVQHLFGPTGYFRLGTRTMNPSGMPGGEKMCYPEEEAMWFSGYVKAFGSELAWNRADEDDVIKALYHSDEVNNLRKIITDSVMSSFDFNDVRSVFSEIKSYVKGAFSKVGKYIRYMLTGKLPIAHGQISITKSASIVDVKRSIATILGLPLNLTATATVSTHFNADGDIEVNTPDTNPNTADIIVRGRIEPQAAVYANVTLVLDAGRVQPRLVHIGTAKTSFKQSARLSIAENYSTNLYIDQMPSEPESVVCEAKYQQYAEVGGKDMKMEMGICKRNETELYERVGGNFTSIEFITPISYPNSTGVPAAPFFPLSGPAEAKLVLRPLQSSPSPSVLHIRFWNDTLLSTDWGTFYATLARDHKTTINATFDWYTVGEKPTQTRVVNLTATSIPATASALFHANTSRRMDIEGWMNLNTPISNTWSYVKFNRSHFYGNATRIRIAPDNDTVWIKIPEFKCEVNGSLVNNTHGNMSAILYLEGSNKPQWLRANFTTFGLMVNITGESSKFNKTNAGYILPYPLKSPVCTYFDQRVITFDGLSYPVMAPQCEYMLVRHRNESDNFAVVVRDSGKNLDVYINGTKYTLSQWGLFVDGHVTPMPYKLRHEIYVREVSVFSHKFIHLSAWLGVDIYFNGEGVHLSINGFYMNQTAGLCGNANYIRSKVDELQTPQCTVAETIEEFVESWKLNDDCSPGPSTPFPAFTAAVMTEAEKTCIPLFTEVAAEAHFVVTFTPYLTACIHDVVTGRGPEASFRAYIMAALSSQVAVEGCHYGRWSDWSGCENGDALKHRNRSIVSNPLDTKCSQTTEERPCLSESEPCDSYKDYLQITLNSKKCHSQHKVVQCPRGCRAILDEPQYIQFHCGPPDAHDEDMTNYSPVILSHRNIKFCATTEDEQED